MSRIGNAPVKVPPKVDVALSAGEISVTGPLRTLSRKFSDDVTIEKDGEQLIFKAANEEAGALQGTLRAIVARVGKGVTQGDEKKQSLCGSGSSAQAGG